MASASSSARWVGLVVEPEATASVPSRQSGTSSRTSRRASATVSTLDRVERGCPARSNAAAQERDVEADVVADEHRAAR